MNNASDWISVSEFAKAAGCSRDTIRKLCKENVLPYRVVNPLAKRVTYRIPRAALDDYLRIQAGEEPASEVYVRPEILN